MCHIKDMKRQSKYGWSLTYYGQQYYVQLDECSSKVSVYVYNDVVGGYQYADQNISEQIVSYLDLQEMQEQDWLQEGEEPQEQQEEDYPGNLTSESIVQDTRKIKQEWNNELANQIIFDEVDADEFLEITYWPAF